MRDPAKYMNDIASILARKAESAKEKMQDSARFVVDKVKESLTSTKEDSDDE